MVEENAIWETAFWDWDLLSHPTRNLQVDKSSAEAIRTLISNKAFPKGLADIVTKMLTSATDPNCSQDIHHTVSEARAQTLCASKDIKRLFKKKFGIDIDAPDWEDRDFAATALQGIRGEAYNIASEEGHPLRALMRFLADFGPDAASGALAIREIRKPRFLDEAPAIKITGTFRSIIFVKDRDLFDIIDEGEYPSRKLRRETPIILLIRGSPIGVSALAIQMDGNELNVADWCCFPIDDEDLFLEQMSVAAREAHFYSDPNFEDYVSGLITSYNLVPGSELQPQQSVDEQESPAVTSPVPARTWSEPVSSLIQKRLILTADEIHVKDDADPLRSQLSAAQEHIARLEAESERIARLLAENEPLRALQDEFDRERTEFSALLQIAEDERSEAIAEAAALRAALRGRAPSASEAAEITEFPLSLSEFEPWANKHLIGRVHILPRAYRSMRKVVFNDVERACRALLLLAGPYLDSKLGVEGANSKFVEGLKDLRLIDKPQLTVGGAMRSSEFYVSYQGEKLFLDKHIRGKDGRYNDEKLLRIYYHFHAATAQVLIGHMPTHLTTSAS
jgi:hypothetical protein